MLWTIVEEEEEEDGQSVMAVTESVLKALDFPFLLSRRLIFHYYHKHTLFADTAISL